MNEEGDQTAILTLQQRRGVSGKHNEAEQLFAHNSLQILQFNIALQLTFNLRIRNRPRHFPMLHTSICSLLFIIA